MTLSLQKKCSCSEHLHVNDILRYDPTRTTTIRNKFVADVTRRFQQIARDIRVSIVDNDCFGLNRRLGIACEKVTTILNKQGSNSHYLKQPI